MGKVEWWATRMSIPVENGSQYSRRADENRFVEGNVAAHKLEVDCKYEDTLDVHTSEKNCVADDGFDCWSVVLVEFFMSKPFFDEFQRNLSKPWLE